jgi:hypothetical protein
MPYSQRHNGNFPPASSDQKASQHSTCRGDLRMDGDQHTFFRSPSTRVCGTRRWFMTEALVASLMLGVAAPAGAEFACKPGLTFKDVRFSKAQNRQRKWTATLTVDASQCAETTGQFEIRFVRLKEFGPNLVFTEKFRWSPGSVEASLNFWWDEAVEDYWIGDVKPCGCADRGSTNSDRELSDRTSR